MTVRDAYTCEFCKYWHLRAEGDFTGSCQRHAPVVLYVPFYSQTEPRTFWPMTPRNDYCGDFSKGRP